MRTIIELPDLQLEALAQICRREGISRAEAIRRAVDRLVATDAATRAGQDLQAGFGLWRHQNLDGRTYTDALRAEWDDQDGEALRA